jgi:hypothetical protein
MSDAPDPRDRRRIRWAVALLLLGFLVAFVPGLAAGDDFVVVTSEWNVIEKGSRHDDHVSAPIVLHFYVRTDGTVLRVPPTSYCDLVGDDLSWATSAATLLVAPLLFLWWRRSALRFGRGAGIACCVVASAAISALVLTRADLEYMSLAWTWGTVPLGGALMVAAFLVAPAPRPRDDA